MGAPMARAQSPRPGSGSLCTPGRSLAGLRAMGAPVGSPARRSSHKTMISGKSRKLLTRKVLVGPRVGFRVRASEHLHIDDCRKFLGGS